MNGFLMFGKQLVCHPLQDDQPNPFESALGRKKYRFINWGQLFRDTKNKEKTPEELRKEVISLLKHEEQKRKKLEELGMTYAFPGFKSLIQVGDE